MDNKEPVTMRVYELYNFRWYIKQYEYCTKHTTTKCHFYTVIIRKNQDGIIGKMLTLIQSTVNNLLQNNQIHVWYQDDISLAEHSLVSLFRFGTTGRNKLKYPKIIE